MEGRVIIIQGQALTENPIGLVVFLKLIIDGSQVVIGRRIVRVQFDNLGVSHGSGLKVSHLLVNVSHIVMKFGFGGIDIDCFNKGIQGLLEFTLPAVDNGNIIKSFNVPGVLYEKSIKFIGGFGKPSLPGQGGPHEQTGFPAVGHLGNLCFKKTFRLLMIPNPD
jgi:hypothetical protein